MKKKLWTKIWDFANFMYGSFHPSNARKLRSFKNIHRQNRCFIIGNGPSLTIADLEMLRNEVTMVSNSIIKIFGDLSYTPTYYFAQDNKVILDNIEMLGKINIIKFVKSHFAKRYHPKGAILYKMNFSDKLGFSTDISRMVYSGQTVTYSMIQFAAYMGFKEIYLLGVDFNYSPNNTEITAQSYFDKRLFNQNTQYHKPEVNVNLAAYKEARQFCEAHGIKIFNATRGGKLEVFERINFDTITK